LAPFGTVFGHLWLKTSGNPGTGTRLRDWAFDGQFLKIWPFLTALAMKKRIWPFFRFVTVG